MKLFRFPFFIFIMIFFLSNAASVFGQLYPPSQSESGPGGKNYEHLDIEIIAEYGKKAGGFWLYLPASPVPDSANVVVFVPGFGVPNPVIYGGWIKHLVGHGNIVIFPRYQKKLFRPFPGKWVSNAVNGIQGALDYLQKEGKVKPRLENIAYTGHSYGAKIAAYLAVKYDQHNLPKPKALLVNQPGLIKPKAAQLKNYKAMDKDIKLLVILGAKDKIVGDDLGLLIFNTAGARQKNLIIQSEDERYDGIIEADHAGPCSIDKQFDEIKRRNYITRAAFKRSTTDAVDYYCYWKLLDGIMDCSFYDKNCQFAFGSTYEQTYMGIWSDGHAAEPLRVHKKPIYPEKSERKNRKIGKGMQLR